MKNMRPIIFILLVTISMLWTTTGALGDLGIRIEMDIPESETPQVVDTVIFNIYGSEDASLPISSQAFSPGEWKADHNFSRIENGVSERVVRFKADFTNTGSLTANSIMWVELEIDGGVVGKRNPMRVVYAGLNLDVGSGSSDDSAAASADSAQIDENGESSEEESSDQQSKGTGKRTLGGEGEGDDNYLVRWDGDSSLESSSIYEADSGKIGIGTTSPVEKFSLQYGNIGLYYGSTYDTYIGFRRGSNPYDNAQIVAFGSESGINESLGIKMGGGDAEPELDVVIRPWGKVGIGTDTPLAKLDIAGGIKIGEASGSSEGVISYNSTNKLMKFYNGQSWVTMANPVVTVGLGGSGADFECDGVDDQVQIQAALDAVENGGGGIVMLLGGSYETSAAINWDSQKVKLQGAGSEATVIECSDGNAFESNTENSRIWLEDLTIKTTGIDRGPDDNFEGIGIYVVSDIVVDLHLDKVKFLTTTNAIHYELTPSSNPSDPHLGNIEITNCLFPQSCINSDGADYVSNKHKIHIIGHKPIDRKLNISFNEFVKHENQRADVVELKCSGDLQNDPFPILPIENQPFIWGGQISFNKFDGATRECMVIRGHRNLNIIGNKLKNSSRIGFYFTRSYQSVISGNICEGSVMRGHRIDNYIETTYVNNIAVNTGAGDTKSVPTGGMTISTSRNNIIMGNIIKADKNAAISIIGDTIDDEIDYGYSTGNYIAFNKILGPYTDIVNDDKENNTGNIIIQPENYGIEYPRDTIVSGLKIEKSFSKGVSSKDLELYLPFFEDSGNYFKDYSKNGVIAEVNGVLNRTKGLFGNAVQFDGNANNYIELDHTIDSYDATYYLIFRPNSFSGIQRLIHTSYSTGRYYILDLTYKGGDYTNVLVRYHDGVDWFSKEFNAPISSTSDIVRLAMTFEENGDNIDAKVYMDGKLMESVTLLGKPSLDSNIAFLGSEPNHPFDGDLHLFKAWGRTLTEEEIWEETFNPVETVALEAYKLKGGTETVTGPDALNPAIENTILITEGVDAFTLDDGVENAEKYITMKTDGGDGTLTPTNLTNGTSIVFDDVGDSAHLKFMDNGWVWFGGTATLN